MRFEQVSWKPVQNPETLFILAFVALLIVAIGFLLRGEQTNANNAGIYAFLLLVAGVIIRMGSLIQQHRRMVQSIDLE